jgi:hypothetical protein
MKPSREWPSRRILRIVPVGRSRLAELECGHHRRVDASKRNTVRCRRCQTILDGAPLIRRGLLPTAMRPRGDKPFHMRDLAVPPAVIDDPPSAGRSRSQYRNSLHAQATALLRRATAPKRHKKSDGGWLPGKKAFDGREGVIDGKPTRRKRRWPKSHRQLTISGGLPSLGKRR